MTRKELESYIRSIDAAAYARTRNYLGGSTNLSEYITRGYIALPAVRSLLLENNSESAAYKLLNELAWRDYWQLVWKVRGDDIFEYIRPLPTTPRQGIPQAVIDASTGIDALDAGIRQLYETGYIHNHMRMWIAGLLCNVARCDWKVGAEWIHSYLIDGDYASNHLSWQWVAGSYTGKTYLPQQDNINEYTRTKQKNTFLDQPYEIIADMPIPEILVPILKSLPHHPSNVPSTTISIDELVSSDRNILLYSPWTLDPDWRRDDTGLRVLLIDSSMYSVGAFSQNVYDSIAWFGQQVSGMYILYGNPQDLSGLHGRITRKYYAGIRDWPGTVDIPTALYPHIADKFYPSFSSYWKQAQKSR